MHHHHHRAAGPVAAGVELAAGAAETAGAVAAAPFGGRPVAGGLFRVERLGDYDCSPGSAGCRPYAAKDWRQAVIFLRIGNAREEVAGRPPLFFPEANVSQMRRAPRRRVS